MARRARQERSSRSTSIKKTAVDKNLIAEQQSGYQTGFSANQSQTKSQTWQLDPKTGISSPVWSSKGSPAEDKPQAGSATSSTATSGGTRASDPATAKTASAGTAASGKTGGTKKKDEVQVVCESPAQVNRTGKWQHFENWITLKQNQDQLVPLTLQVTNGDGGAAYSAVKLMLSGRPLATDKDFKSNALSMSMVGALGVGQNQLIIDGYGPVGARISWKVTTLKASLASVTPTSTAPTKEITLNGKNFSSKASLDQVMVGDKPATIKSASGKQIVALVPEGVSGEQLVSVAVAGFPPTKGIKITVQAAPEVTGIDMISAPPGNALTITGKGFSTKGGENQVLINGVQATITSVSATSISIVIPKWSHRNGAVRYQW